MGDCSAVLLDKPVLADDKEKVAGVWKLVSVVYEDAQTKERTPVLGQHPKGCQIATPEGRWLALVTAEGRKIPQTDAERSDALRTMIAYTGKYRVEGGKVITKVERHGMRRGLGRNRSDFTASKGTGCFSKAHRNPIPTF